MSRPLRVCRVINAFRIGGVQMMMIKLLPKLRELGADPHVIVTRMPGKGGPWLRRQAGIKPELVKVEGRVRPMYLRRLARRFREGEFDVVHTHMYSANVPGTIAARMAGVKCIVSQAHNVETYKNVRQRALDRALMPMRDRFFVISEAVRRDMAAALWLPESRFDIVYNAVEQAGSAALPSPADVRASIGVAPDAVMVLHAARFHPQKNHVAFLHEWPRLVRENPRLHLVLAGDGKERPAAETAVREGGAEASVTFLGDRSDVHALMTAADISILPSRKEGLGNVILEGWMYGAPPLVTDVGAARELIAESQTGLITPAGDMTAFGNALLRLAADRDLRESIAKAGRRRAEDFSLDRMAERTMELYEEVLRRKG